MTSIVDSAAWADVEDFQFGRILPEDHAEIADPLATMPSAHRDHHVGE
jgi:hypothetical protein